MFSSYRHICTQYICNAVHCSRIHTTLLQYPTLHISPIDKKKRYTQFCPLCWRPNLNLHQKRFLKRMTFEPNITYTNNNHHLMTNFSPSARSLTPRNLPDLSSDNDALKSTHLCACKYKTKSLSAKRLRKYMHIYSPPSSSELPSQLQFFLSHMH